MRLAKAFATLLWMSLVAQSIVAQSNPFPSLASPPMAQDRSQVLVISAERVQSIYRVADVEPGLAWIKLFNSDTDGAFAERRTTPREAELHTKAIDMWYVLSGKASLLTGGSLVDPKEVVAGEFLGRAISGGDEREISAGDVVRIPAGVAHWVRKIDGKEFVYLNFKSRSTAPTDANCPNRSLGDSSASTASTPFSDVDSKLQDAREATQQVLAVDEARRLAMLHGDITALDALLADDVTFFWGDGTADNKASALELFRSGQLRYTQLEYGDTRVRLYGDSAVVTGQARIKMQVEGHEKSQTVRVTRVYIHQQGRWQMVANQTTRVSPTA